MSVRDWFEKPHNDLDPYAAHAAVRGWQAVLVLAKAGRPGRVA